MISGNDVRSGFLEVMLRENSLMSMCPFFDHDHYEIACPFEGWKIKLEGDLYFQYDLIKHTDNGKPFPCKCMGWKVQEFRECSTFQDAMKQYKANPVEFAALMDCLDAKKWYEYEARKNPSKHLK